MWPVIIAAPPIAQLRPMRALPAMPTQPAIAVCAPMRQLWPIWIWLSSLTSSSITVSSMAPRSIVVLAPISTSAPITTRPICGILSQRPPSSAIPKPSAPMTAPLWTTLRGADHAAVVDGDVARAARVSSPIAAPAPITQPAPMRARSPTTAPRADHRTRDRPSRSAATARRGSTTARGCDARRDRRRRMQDRRDLGVGGVRIGVDELRQRRRGGDVGRDDDGARAGRRQLDAIRRIGEEARWRPSPADSRVGDAGDRDPAVAFETRAGALRELGRSVVRAVAATCRRAP